MPSPAKNPENPQTEPDPRTPPGASAEATSAQDTSAQDTSAQDTSPGEADSSASRAAGTELVRFDNVTKRFGDVTVLDQLNFSVDTGKHVTLIGPSGSGKTTILRLLMTLLTPEEGTITVDGQYLTHEQRGGKLVKPSEKHVREVRKKIGMVFQHFNLFPNMRVLRNVMEAPVHVLGLSKDEAEQRAKELVELVGLTEHLDKYPSQLSGGQQQRVAIARALAMRPQVLLLDEVTSALDPELVAGVLDVLRDIALSTDITMLVVTHEMSFARDISDAVLMFDKGKIVESGPPDKIFSEPEHDRTKEFLATVL